MKRPVRQAHRAYAAMGGLLRQSPGRGGGAAPGDGARRLMAQVPTPDNRARSVISVMECHSVTDRRRHAASHPRQGVAPATGQRPVTAHRLRSAHAGAGRRFWGEEA